MPSNTHNTCAALTALLLLLCSAPTAWAQDDDAEQAGENYQIAVDLLNEGRYAESVDAFTRAIELSPDPVFYCNRSAALVRLLEYERAIEDLTHCRDNLADAPEITARADAQLKALSLYTRSVRGRALGVARDEIAQMADMCEDHVPNTLLTVSRELTDAGVREAFRVIAPQDAELDLLAVHGSLDD